MSMTKINGYGCYDYQKNGAIESSYLIRMGMTISLVSSTSMKNEECLCLSHLSPFFSVVVLIDDLVLDDGVLVSAPESMIDMLYQSQFFLD